MTKNYFWPLWLAANIFWLFSCGVPYVLVNESRLSAPENFAVDLPQGWRRHNASADLLVGVKTLLEKRRKLGWDVIRLTRDGLFLQQISIGRMPVSDELPHTKRKLAPRMIPLEVAEVLGDELRSNANLTHQEISENLPANVGGYPGFKLHYTYRTEERLRMETLFYGALVGPWLYYLLYEAPAQHYFAKDLQVFETLRRSFQITQGPS